MWTLLNREQYPTNAYAKAFIAKNFIHFNTPGHRSTGIETSFNTLTQQHLFKLDMIDVNVLEATVLKDVNEQMASAYKADRCFLSTQGTSTAVMAMILATCTDGGKVIVPRNVHRSVISGIILAGAEPLFLETEFNQTFGISNHFTSKALKKALAEHATIQAVLLINPTYFGVCTDLKNIVSIAHHKGVPVIVDEAHGAHLRFNDNLPISAMEAGADLAATSLHKLGGSMNQTSILLYRQGLVDVNRVQNAMNYLLSTSRPYQMIASLDSTRYQLEREGKNRLQSTLTLANHFRSKVNQLQGLSCPTENDLLHSDASFDYDQSKVLIQIDSLPISGYELKEKLEVDYKILLELADVRYALAIFTTGTSPSDMDKLYDALEDIVSTIEPSSPPTTPVIQPPNPTMVLTPRQASFATTKLTNLNESLGMINTEFVISYPPGIPILIPGEEITQQHIDYIVTQRDSGATFVGSHDPRLENITIVQKLN